MPVAGFDLVMATLFVAAQGLYLLSFAVDLHLFTLPVNFVEPRDGPYPRPTEPPLIVLFYPVLRELESTMRTTFTSLQRLDYPAGRYRVVAVPNRSDHATIARLRKLQDEFAFLEVLETPPTSDPAWDVVWADWDRNPNAYWWRRGPRARDRDLPPKKTRQLIYAFYTVAASTPGDFLVNYIDADSCPPADHFLAGAAGMQEFDVLQSQNVAGNLNKTLAASWHALDHMIWDGGKYPHLSADGKQPYWVLGKGLFFRASDLLRLGGFHPWIAIEDPEVGMRFWKAGLRLGVIRQPLIEEVPETFGHGITQRKRWVCGFFQSLTAPLTALNYTPAEKAKAWLNFLPCLSLSINLVGAPTGAWALWKLLTHAQALPFWTWGLAAVNLLLLAASFANIYVRTWKRTALVLETRRERMAYMLRVNPVFVMVWWCVWIIPLAMGLWMFLRDQGLVWERTEKTNANEALIEKLAVVPATASAREGARPL